jgi:hypothetical protein
VADLLDERVAVAVADLGAEDGGGIAHSRAAGNDLDYFS